MTTPISRQTLENALFTAGVDFAANPPQLADDLYMCLPSDWVAGPLSDRLRVKITEDVGLYDPEDADCDDFSDCAVVEVKKEHRKFTNRPPHVAVAFGWFWYTKENGAGGHSICMFIDRENGVPFVQFYEPQTCRIVQLTRKEIGTGLARI